MQAMPKEVVDKANTAARIEGPAQFVKDVDLEVAGDARASSPSWRSARRSSIRPSSSSKAMLTHGRRHAAPAYAPYMGIISPVLDRCFKAGGYPLVEGYTRDDYRKSYRQDGRPGRRAAQGRRADRRRHRRLGHRAGPRARALPAGRDDPRPRRCRPRPSSRRASSAPTSAPARSRSARKPTWCWSTATCRRTSARCAGS